MESGISTRLTVARDRQGKARLITIESRNRSLAIALEDQRTAVRSPLPLSCQGRPSGNDITMRSDRVE